MTATTCRVAQRVAAALDLANGRRRERTLTAGGVAAAVRQHLLTGEESSITHQVAGNYGFAAVGTYLSVLSKTRGTVVISIWVESANRVGTAPGVTARRADRVQEQVDSLPAANDPAFGFTRLVLSRVKAARFAARTDTEAGLLAAVRRNPVAAAALADHRLETGLTD